MSEVAISEEVAHMATMLAGCKYLLHGHHLNSSNAISAINAMFAAAVCHSIPTEPNASKTPSDWTATEWLWFFQSMVAMSRDAYDD